MVDTTLLGGCRGVTGILGCFMEIDDLDKLVSVLYGLEKLPLKVEVLRF